eukprot:scaffold180017_cov28-Tisochrysis_lutea.AAC.1
MERAGATLLVMAGVCDARLWLWLGVDRGDMGTDRSPGRRAHKEVAEATEQASATGVSSRA